MNTNRAGHQVVNNFVKSDLKRDEIQILTSYLT